MDVTGMRQNGLKVKMFLGFSPHATSNPMILKNGKFFRQKIETMSATEIIAICNNSAIIEGPSIHKATF